MGKGGMKTRIMLVADEFFSWGVYGGFGAFTRKLGRELAKRGIEVDAVVQKISASQKGVGESEVIDGVNVRTLPRSKSNKLWRKDLYLTDADVIHSQCGMIDTWLTFRRNPSVKRIVTVQDYRTKGDLASIKAEEPQGAPKRAFERLAKRLYGSAMRTSNGVFCQAELLYPKIRQAYGVDAELLPNFVDVPGESALKKSDDPSVVWLGRLDPIKRFHLCAEAAALFPSVTFYVLGSAGDAEPPKAPANVQLLGFNAGSLKEEVLSKAWVLINTSAYECLPVSFLEACAHKCAILSTQNPDSFASSFGFYTTPSGLAAGLKYLLRDDKWRRAGQKGYDYVREHHETSRCVQDHISIYRRLTE